MDIIIIGVEHVFCCRKRNYSKITISAFPSDLLSETLELIEKYEDSYFLDDCLPQLYQHISEQREKEIDENEYKILPMKYTHVHC